MKGIMIVQFRSNGYRLGGYGRTIPNLSKIVISNNLYAIFSSKFPFSLNAKNLFCTNNHARLSNMFHKNMEFVSFWLGVDVM